ncbi:MAG: type IX secretion system membrane protein PorP/SprF [Bacteroidia bacterium]|nr:type IX secretion system membrane protein PorP/SprF [Bacteroidia bacterium]NND10102.1 type IX secretion system membrane protein PorP/SprF [Flavobacteriaceae bacterium]MBT8308882.1 type IX secretion system membrane protein PorP/SprF [Bacteroidia bacterium]NNK27983.1 type IX secretion system membrane protein PorP/SprF [Flavobacteriaceae bacterium]NNL60365.1 type IX secretion system membrane protein PorP/SprF [Flavobacteriaceae bacterium]
MNINKNNIVTLALILISSIGYAQQLPQFTEYMFNTISINPAYAGSRETLSIVGLHRSQWTEIEKGPTTQTLSLHTPLRNEKIGLGVSIINDSPGYENFLYAYADISYTINTGRYTKLAFGIKGGFTHYNLDQQFLDDPRVLADPFFGNYADKWNPNVGVGAFLHSDRWYIGLSAPRILNTDYNLTEETGGAEYVALERVSYYLTGGYVFDLANDVKLKPSFLVKATNGAPISVDLNANFLLFEKLWLGGSYRYNENTGAIAGIADFQISKQLRIGYAYDHYISDVRPYFGGTHEVLLMFEINQRDPRRVKSPRYF